MQEACILVFHSAKGSFVLLRDLIKVKKKIYNIQFLVYFIIPFTFSINVEMKMSE